jgi:hypothetical protein
MAASCDARGAALRWAVGGMPYMRVKLVVNEPTLRRPTDWADLGDRARGGAQHGGGALQPPGEYVGVWGVAERAAELAAEVCPRASGGFGHVLEMILSR